MREQLVALEELARNDLAGRQVEVELQEIQARLDELRGDVEKIRELLDREREQLAEAERMRKDHLGELEVIADKTARSKKRHDTAKNNREMEASARELEVLRREKDEREAEAARLEAVVGQVREEITRHEGDFKQLTDLLASDEAEAKTRADALDARRAEGADARKTLASKVRPDLLRIYQMALSRRGSGVADCIEGICRGCRMTIPPQLYNQLLRLDRVYQCPSCNRILLPVAVMR